VNATIANNVTIGRDNWVSPGMTLMRNTEPNTLFKAMHAEPAKVPATRFFRVEQ
jgi:hypothetical protein